MKQLSTKFLCSSFSAFTRMNKIAVTSLLLAFWLSNSFAGSETDSKNVTLPQSLCPSWYADNEWNIDLFGAYAFTANEYLRDRYLDVDHAWGVGVDAKYFFYRYFGLGIEGYVLDADRTVVDRNGFVGFLGSPPVFTVNSHAKKARAIGTALGTLTLRYPIRCTRFAAYAFAGGGGIFGGAERDILKSRVNPFAPNSLLFSTKHTGTRSESVGQFGGGVEFRVTPHIGIINDFSWNVINGANNNFGMVRSGINFAF